MKSILVVTPGVELRHRLSETLSRSYRIIEAESGEQALRLAPKELPDLILMTIVMPRMNGLEVAAQLRETLGPNHLSIILLGSLPPIGMKDEPLASLIDGFLNIDLPADAMLAGVQTYLH